MAETRGRRLLLGGLFAFGLLLVGVGARLALLPNRPPERLILIVVDTLRRDFVSAYGSRNGRTQNIDRLAARGDVFTQFTASFHQTSMSMGALFTGRTPSIEHERPEQPLFWNSFSWCGLHRFTESTEPDQCIPTAIPTLAETLREAGFETIGVTSNQFLYEPSGYSRGFDDWVEVGERPPDVGPIARLTLKEPARSRFWMPVHRAVLDALNRRKSDRFFLYVHYMDVHDHHSIAGDYGESVATVDRAIGRLLDQLERSELLEGATVVFTSDHGERLREIHALKGESGHLGNPAFQEPLRVPLIVAPPTKRDPSAFLRTEDLFYLILEIAGVSTQRRSDLEPDELFVSELEHRTYLRGRFKTTIRRSDGALTLFDLETDPGETRDATEAHPDVVAAHRLRIEELSERLRARKGVSERLSADDRARLEALGYLEPDD